MARQLLRLEAGGGAAASAGPSLAAQWNALALDCICRHRPALPVATRTLAILHTSIYNAWAAYDDAARQTAHGVAVRLPRDERSAASQAAAMGHAACRALARSFPSCAPAGAALLARLGYGGMKEEDAPGGPLCPAGIGRMQAAAVLDARGNGDADPFAAQVRRLAAEWQPVRQAAMDTAFDAATVLAALCRPARQVAGQDGDVLLLFALANALDDAARAAGAGALDAAAAEVLRRFTGGEVAPGIPAPEAARGRQVGALVFDKARRYWLGKL